MNDLKVLAKPAACPLSDAEWRQLVEEAAARARARHDRIDAKRQAQEQWVMPMPPDEDEPEPPAAGEWPR